MLLSDKENAQELLEEWPEMCRKHDIPLLRHARTLFLGAYSMGSRYDTT